MIYDAFTFFNEFTQLEIRLRELDSVVDHFVVVESPWTFSGKRKPLWFWENRERFAYWLPRISHVVVEDMPNTGNAWANEYHQRNAIERGLLVHRHDDVILLSDVDEIPRADSVRTALRTLTSRSPILFDQTLYYYYVNCKAKQPAWYGTRMAFRDTVETLQQLRESWGLTQPYAGWHYTYFGGVESIQAKLAGYSHHDFHNQPKFTNRAHLEICLRDLRHFDGSYGFDVVPLTEAPRCVQDDPDRFRDVIYGVPEVVPA